MTDALTVHELGVSFGGLQALREVTISISEGEIHGLIGPNGAGKTTLINVLTGLIRPSRGRIQVFDAPIPRRVSKLRAAGIARTFQAPVVFREMSAVENVMFGGVASTSTGLIGSVFGSRRFRAEEKQVRSRALELLERVGFDADPTQLASMLSFGNERKVEVARALMFEPRLLFLDEPTAGFSKSEVNEFSGLLKSISADAKGTLTILLVEHNVPFIFDLCDRVTALDDGVVVGHGSAPEVRADPAVIKSYVGAHQAEPPSAVVQRQRAITEVRSRTAVAEEIDGGLQTENLTAGYGRAMAIRDVCIRVAPGEIVAVLGRNGAGKSTLFNSVMRTVRPRSGTVTWNGRNLHRLATEKIVAHGVALVPQTRAVLTRQTVQDNLRLAVRGSGASRDVVRQRLDSVYDIFPRLVERRDQLGGRLSGGERQMLAIAKALMRQPGLLMLDEPSIGLAVGVVRELQQVVARINQTGTAVLIAEQNVGWVVPLADRGYVLDSGRILEDGPMEELGRPGDLAAQFLGAS